VLRSNNRQSGCATSRHAETTVACSHISSPAYSERACHMMASTINTAYRSISGSALSHDPGLPRSLCCTRCFPAMLHSPRIVQQSICYHLAYPGSVFMHLVPRLDLHDVFRRCSLGSLASAKLPLSVADVVIRQCFVQESTIPIDVGFRQCLWLSLASTKLLLSL
jgi:hypothetical protein